MGLVPKLLQSIDDRRRIKRPLPPFDGDPPVGQVDACTCNIRDAREPSLDLEHASRARDAVDGKIEPCNSTAEVLNKMRKIRSFSHRLIRHGNRTRLRDRNNRSEPRSASMTRSH